MKNHSYPLYKKIGFIAGPLLFLLLTVTPIAFFEPNIQKVIAVAIWMVIWWITEAVAIPVTALLPLAIFPMADVASIKEVASNYANPIIFLFLGGFILALALEKVNLHRRIALNIIKLTGTNANGVIFGFMVATALMSMWISNTASTVVMLPIATSVIGLLINDSDGFTANDKNFALAIMLGIAFSANIGGTATIIGTPPNTVAAAFLEKEYNLEIGFLNWMKLGVPFAIVMLGICYFVLVKWFYPNNIGEMKSSENIIQAELQKLGKMSKDEKVVTVIFILTALAWVLRSSLNNIFPQLNLSDAGISMLGALAMFVIPLDFNKGNFTLNWQDTRNLPWGILLLFGGGLALAGALKNAGIIDQIGTMIASYEGISIFVVTVALITIMLFLTELMSNVALTAVFVPVVAGIAIGLDIPMLHLVVPVTLAASCAFMLPMATPPNAIVFAGGYIKVYEMAKVGIVLNIIAVSLLVLVAKFILPIVL